MNPKHLGYMCAFLLAATGTFGQGKKYLYYFDKNFNYTDKEQAVYNGIGMNEDSSIKLIVFHASDKSLVFTEHFTDTSLQVPDGVFQSYYKNVAVEIEGSYLKDKKDGLWQRWDSLGVILDSSIYSDGKRVMQAIFSYRANGSPEREIIHNFKTDSTETTTYDDNGKIVSTVNLKNIEDEDKVFTKAEIEASFPGGAAAWSKYIMKCISNHINAIADDSKSSGTCQVKFIVDKQGNITEVEALTLKGSRLAEVVIEAIEKGPKWIPAMQNGRVVKAYRIQPVTFSAH